MNAPRPPFTVGVICARSPDTEYAFNVKETRRSGTQRLHRRGASRKNQALRRWLVRFAAQPDDRGQQWWEDFDALLRRTRMRLRPIDA